MDRATSTSWELTSRHLAALLTETKGRTLTILECERISAGVEFLDDAKLVLRGRYVRELSDLEADTLTILLMKALKRDRNSAHNRIRIFKRTLLRRLKDPTTDIAPVKEFFSVFNGILRKHVAL